MKPTEDIIHNIDNRNITSVEFVIPTLNEENSIGDLINQIRSLKTHLKKFIMVTDAGSTDKTVEICKQENILVINRKEKGKGSGIREAAKHSNADILIFIDGDGTYRIDNLEKFLDPILTQKADMVIGSRMLGKRDKGSISTFNLLGNKIFNNAINFAMKTKITDSQSGIRAMRKKTFHDLFLSSNSFDIEVEMTAEALAKGYKVKEVPITYINRKDSKPKLNPLKDGARIARTLFFIIINYKPLLFFGIMSLSVLAISLYPTILVIHEKVTLGDIIHIPAVILSAVLLVTSVLLMVLGILSDLIVSSRRRIENMLSQYKPNY